MGVVVGLFAAIAVSVFETFIKYQASLQREPLFFDVDFCRIVHSRSILTCEHTRSLGHSLRGIFPAHSFRDATGRTRASICAHKGTASLSHFSRCSVLGVYQYFSHTNELSHFGRAAEHSRTVWRSLNRPRLAGTCAERGKRLAAQWDAHRAF